MRLHTRTCTALLIRYVRKSLLHLKTRQHLIAMRHRTATRKNLTCLIDQAHLTSFQL